jgi:hypothetical protein
MANLTPTAALADVPQLEIGTYALAGPGGPMNAQAQALLNRIQYVIETLLIQKANLESANVFTKAQARSMLDLGNVSGTVSIDWTESNSIRMVLTGDVTIPNPTGLTHCQNNGLWLIQGGAGGHTVTWGSKFLNAPTSIATAVGSITYVPTEYNPADDVTICGLIKGGA